MHGAERRRAAGHSFKVVSTTGGAAIEKATEAETPSEDDGFDYDAYALTHLTEYDEYVGKPVLISLTYLHHTGAVKRKIQLHGIVTRINEAVIAVERQDTGDEFTIPTDLGALKVAAEGEYHLKPSGEVVVNPDYLAVWMVTEHDPDAAPPAA